MTTSALPRPRQPRSVPPLDEPGPRRGVTLVLDVPDTDDVTLVEIADVLLELARELVPAAAARTQVTLAGPAPVPALRVVDGERR